MAPRLIFGAGSIGTTPDSFTFTWDTPEKVSGLLDELKRLGLLELDSAASYPPTNPWNAETLLGQSRAVHKGFTIDSKALAKLGEAFLGAEKVEESIDRTLSLLGTDRVRTFYAHANDGLIPLEEQAAAFDRQFRLGKFEKYGLSNYSAADIAKIFAICDEKGYVKPSVYEGNYNALTRKVENEIIPLLRKHNCAFHAYSPLAGGFLTGKVTLAADHPGSLDRTRWVGKSAFLPYVKYYDTPAMHAAIRTLKAACDAASPPLTLQEAAIRWLLHHSALSGHDGDAVILGAKTLEQIRANTAEARRGPLPEAVRVVVDSLGAIAVERGHGGSHA